MIMLSPFIGFLGSPIAWIGGFVLGFWLPKFWLNRRKGKRLKAFNSNLADTIMLLANSLRAGSSFLQSVEMVVREAQPPISTEFARVIREVNLGLPLDDALANLSRRVRSDDLDLMTTAIAIHHRSAATSPRSSTRSPTPSASASASRARSGRSPRSSACRGYVVGFLPVALVAAAVGHRADIHGADAPEAARAARPARRLLHPRPRRHS